MHCLANARQRQVRITRVPCAEDEVKNEKLVLRASKEGEPIEQYLNLVRVSKRIWYSLGLITIKSDSL